MGTISHSDILFATVRRMGRTIYNGRLTGYGSLDEVVRDIHTALGPVGGLATLSLRNGSQGWAASHSFNLGRDSY